MEWERWLRGMVHFKYHSGSVLVLTIVMSIVIILPEIRKLQQRAMATRRLLLCMSDTVEQKSSSDSECSSSQSYDGETSSAAKCYIVTVKIRQLRRATFIVKHTVVGQRQELQA